MLYFVAILASCVALCAAKTASDGRQSEVRRFPEGFMFGTATASYQIEGGWDADDKGESIWDHLTHTNPSAVVDQSNGDIADDSYHQYRRDVEMMRELGLDYYRLSFSWPRILPTSFPDRISAAGVQYYNNLIDEMLRYNITPMVTLYHWDLPQKLQEMGGWTNPHIVDWFADYARVVFELFGDKVKYWMTINEPLQICSFGYADASLAPLLNIEGVAEYMCAKNLLLAHAKAYHIYDQEFRSTQNGQIFIAISASWYEPENEQDEEAAEDSRQFYYGLYTHPIFSSSGDFPPVVKERVAAKSAEQGFFRSRLPEFTPAEVEFVRGSSDILGLNHYQSYIIFRNESVNGFYESPSFNDDMEAMRYRKEEWIAGRSSRVRSYPPGFYRLLTKLREDYNNPPVLITENGFASPTGIDDDDRVAYYRAYLNAMLDAIDEGSNIIGYTAWSLMDNFEWLEGYTERFGLYEVDYTSPLRTRTPRKSAFVYKEIVRTGTLDPNFEPAPDAVMTIDQGH